MIIQPNTRGHYPKGYPRSATGGGGVSDDQNIEIATDKPDLQIFKRALDDVQGPASDYYRRITLARDWRYARWPGQTIDGRKWPLNDGEQCWPWNGASDVRVNLIDRIICQHRTLATFAMRNMKVQAAAARPFVSQRESQQATTVLNWTIFTQMGPEMHRELRLATSWRNGDGSAILKLDWEQERLLEYIDVSVMALQEFLNNPNVRQFMQGQTGLPLGEGLNLFDMQEMIMDPAYADDLAVLIRQMSQEAVSLKKARSLLDDLRQLRVAQIPVPQTLKSKPRITARRPMMDVFFPAHTYDLQLAPWIAEIEYVSETTLRDRVVTAEYDEAFVNEALQHRGPSSGTNVDWTQSTLADRAAIYGNTGGTGSLEENIELIHFHTRANRNGLPVRYDTVFHRDVDRPGKHGPCGYKHGEACFHAQRFEIEDSRPIIQSRGITERAYTWEQEIKKQRDGRADRTDLALRPVRFTTYEDLQKLKQTYHPGSWIPVRKWDVVNQDKAPMWDPGSIEIEKTVENMVREHFGIFGVDIDPDLKKLRQEEFVDDTLTELKPVFQQMLELIKQLGVQSDIEAIVGPMERPFSAIDTKFEISATCDLRNIDEDWMKQKIPLVAQILQMDVTGRADRAFVVKNLLEGVDYSFADMAIRDEEPATQAEIQDEQRAIDLIIGSGQDQPLPQGANYQLRLQTLQAKVQAIPQNPVTMQIVQEKPKIMEVIMNREKFFQRQLQQMQNAQIGRMQVGTTFTNQAPQVAERNGSSY
jgi:hypothetical protein